ncbi:MAG: hypothetical protein WCL02_06000 [bacterium]
MKTKKQQKTDEVKRVISDKQCIELKKELVQKIKKYGKRSEWLILGWLIPTLGFQAYQWWYIPSIIFGSLYIIYATKTILLRRKEKKFYVIIGKALAEKKTYEETRKKLGI